MVGERGLMGVTGRECWRYQANTVDYLVYAQASLCAFVTVYVVIPCYSPLCPNLEGSEDAPATAKRGDEKNVLSAASISASRFWPLVIGMCISST